METNIAIVRPKEVVNNPFIAKTMEHLITVTHSDNVSPDEVIGMLRSAFTCYTLEKRTNCSSDIQMTLEQAYNYIKKYRFKVKTIKTEIISTWKYITTVKFPTAPFSVSVSNMYNNKTFLNSSILNYYGLSKLFGDKYIISPVKDTCRTNNYQINAVVKMEMVYEEEPYQKHWDIYVREDLPVNTEVEAEDTF